jgi:branched-chain amino acid transport system ATP-binding protein
LLELSNIEVSYGKVQALKGISLKVEEGKIVSVLGANGAGKTTLLNTIMGLIGNSKGSIKICDKEISKKFPYERVNMGIILIPEGRRIFPDFSVAENLHMGAYQRTDRIEVQRDIKEIYNLFPILKERRKQRAKTLSGGEAQMLAIGRGLMARPRILLLDEPSMGLMPSLTTEIFRVIKGLPGRGITVLLVEQNAKKALSVSHEAAVLELGRIILKGPSKDLIGNRRVKEAYLGG